MDTRVIDGRAIAKEIESVLQKKFLHLKENGITPSLEVLSFGDDPATRSFLGIKKRVAERLGVDLLIHSLPADTVREMAEGVVDMLINTQPHGVVVQLPLPMHIEKIPFLNRIPMELDIDCISERSLEVFEKGKSLYMSPVALAIDEIITRLELDLQKAKVAIIGYGDLVGKPVSFLMNTRGADYTIFDSTSDLNDLRNFDIIISGAGRPGIVKSDFVKQGVILIDAGTSESAGKLVGDIDESAFRKASAATPVPGGVGPITVVKLFENLLRAIENKQNAQSH